jgi:hypothetical protein
LRLLFLNVERDLAENYLHYFFSWCLLVKGMSFDVWNYVKATSHKGDYFIPHTSNSNHAVVLETILGSWKTKTTESCWKNLTKLLGVEFWYKSGNQSVELKNEPQRRIWRSTLECAKERRMKERRRFFRSCN